ncbi:MAG TPA: YkgJ family cysteine cluster protein [Kofleriaceae bacterium]
MTAVRTLGQFVEDEQIVTWLADNVAEINRAATRNAKQVGKQSLMQVACTSCKVTKMCCYSIAIARLYEGVILAAELRKTGRDTPELREQLRARAEAMEAASPYEWSTPCLFLDDKERCTVYAVRPTSCGTLLVYSDPELCVSRSREIQAYVPHQELAAASQLEEMFRQRLALRQKVGRRYLGVLPRMALVALEAWDRTDFRDYLRQLPWPGEAELANWGRNEPLSAERPG